MPGASLKHVDTAALATDPEKRVEFMADFIGFTDADRAALAESLAVLGPRLPALLDALYEHLLSYDDVRRVFLGEQGELSPEYMEVRKEHLTAWALKTATAASGPEFARWLVSVGRRHTGVSGDPGRSVPPRYMVGLVAFVQSALWSTLFDALPSEPERVRRMGLAWSKMLGLQLELFLKQMAPHWPNWD